MAHEIFDIAALRERTRVFEDRSDAGKRLGELAQKQLGQEDVQVLAVPAGGVPVAVALCRRNGWPLDVAVVSKITLPWNSEAGYGAVAFDGSVHLNERFLLRLGLSPQEIDEGIETTRAKVRRRSDRFRGERPWPELRGKTVLLVDDGLASGFTLRAAVAAVRERGGERIAVAVPTGHQRSLEQVAQVVDTLLCANIRSGVPFAVADAYRIWRDLGEDEAQRLLCPFLGQGS